MSKNRYIAGFLLSLVLTLTAYLLVSNYVNSANALVSGNALLATVIILAVAQLYVQLRFFLHLGQGSSAKWNLTVFGFMLIVLFILVFGTLWIMKNLKYHMMSPTETEQYIEEEELIER